VFLNEIPDLKTKEVAGSQTTTAVIGNPVTELKDKPDPQTTSPVPGNTTDTKDASRETWFTEVVDNLVGGGAPSVTLLASIIARIGAVLVGIFLIQILSHERTSSRYVNCA